VLWVQVRPQLASRSRPAPTPRGCSGWTLRAAGEAGGSVAHARAGAAKTPLWYCKGESGRHGQWKVWCVDVAILCVCVCLYIYGCV
jgi:hypothetical protein